MTENVPIQKEPKHPHLTAKYDRPEHHDTAIDEIAKLLTRGPVETIEHIEQIEGLEDKDVLRSNAEHMDSVLSEESAGLRERIDTTLAQEDQQTREKTLELLEAIDSGDEEKMRALGINFEYAWINDVVATMLKGNPPLEIETVGPYAYAHINPETDRLEIDATKIPPDEMAGIIMAGILRKVDPVAHNTRIVSLLDEMHNPITGRDFTPEEQDEYVAAVVEFFGQAGVLMPDDEPGKDFVLLRESELSEKVVDLESALKQSGQGEIIQNEKGELIFKPNADLVDALALHSEGRVKSFKEQGIKLRDASGKPTCQAMDAAGFLNPINKKYMHVIMIDKDMSSQQDKTYALLKALGTVKQERYHNIFFDSDKLSPEIVAYGVTRSLERHTKTFLAALDSYEEWQDFDPYEYVERNYGEKILPEDQEIIEFVISSLDKLGIQPGSLERVADIGAGPNLYPAMLMAPYVRGGSPIDMIEFSIANREYMKKLTSGELGGSHAETWHKFEELMQKVGGEKYAGSEEKAKKSCRVMPGSIFELPENEYDLVSSYFVAESITDTNLPFREAIMSLARATKPGGVMVIAHMVHSEGYHAGFKDDEHEDKKNFPAINLSTQELAEAYRDAGLEFEILQVGEQDASDKAREGYEGMAIVVARRKI